VEVLVIMYTAYKSRKNFEEIEKIRGGPNAAHDNKRPVEKEE
jgi:hypothetical protein